MRDYYQMIGVDPFSILPLTFLIQNANDSEYRKLELEFKKIDLMQKKNKKIAGKLIKKHLQQRKKELKAKGQRPLPQN